MYFSILKFILLGFFVLSCNDKEIDDVFDDGPQDDLSTTSSHATKKEAKELLIKNKTIKSAEEISAAINDFGNPPGQKEIDQNLECIDSCDDLVSTADSKKVETVSKTKIILTKLEQTNLGLTQEEFDKQPQHIKRLLKETADMLRYEKKKGSCSLKNFTKKKPAIIKRKSQGCCLLFVRMALEKAGYDNTFTNPYAGGSCKDLKKNKRMKQFWEYSSKGKKAVDIWKDIPIGAVVVYKNDQRIERDRVENIKRKKAGKKLRPFKEHGHIEIKTASDQFVSDFIRYDKLGKPMQTRRPICIYVPTK